MTPSPITQHPPVQRAVSASQQRTVKLVLAAGLIASGAATVISAAAGGGGRAIEGVCALVALVVTMSAFAYAHVVGRQLSPIRDAISQYGISPEPLRLCYRSAVLGLTIAAVALRLGLAPHLIASGHTSVLTALTVFAAGRAVVGWIPMDPPGAAPTAAGRIHWLLGAVSFAAATSAAATLSSVLHHQARWHSLATFSSACSWAMLLGAAPLLLSRFVPRLRPRFGAYERLFYASATVWLTGLSVALALNRH